MTVEAFAAARPVITCRDSGGPAELVTHERSGLVVDADRRPPLRRAFRRLIDDPDTAARLGAEGAALARTLTWPATVKRLLVPVN